MKAYHAAFHSRSVPASTPKPNAARAPPRARAARQTIAAPAPTSSPVTSPLDVFVYSNHEKSRLGAFPQVVGVPPAGRDRFSRTTRSAHLTLGYLTTAAFIGTFVFEL